MKILITGTHFTPAQALVEQLNLLGSFDLIYVGRKSTREGDKTGSVESQILPGLGVRFIPLISGRLNRSFSLWTIISLLKLPFGFIQSFWIVLKEQPDIVVSFGGYLAFPIVFWSWWFSIPVVIHEQTLRLGLANWLSFPLASKVALSFMINKYKTNPKIEMTGNPIRLEMLSPTKPNREIAAFLKAVNKPLLLVMGGNQGSHFINRLIGRNLAELTKHYSIVHQTGDSQFKDYEYLVEEQKKLAQVSYFPTKWLHTTDLSAVIEKSDLIISRAGMNTLYELALRKKPVLIIPIPASINQEQLNNAKFFAKAQLGDFMTQGEITDQVFLHRLTGIMQNLAKFAPADQAKELFIADGAERLAQLVLSTKY